MNKNEIVKLRVMQVDDRDVPAKYIEAFNSYLDKVVIPHFEKQLAEKDEEIETLKSIGGNLIWKDIDRNKQLKDQRHEICEEIRVWCKENYCSIEDYAKQSSDGYYPADKFDKKLDQIEKAVEDDR